MCPLTAASRGIETIDNRHCSSFLKVAPRERQPEPPPSRPSFIVVSVVVDPIVAILHHYRHRFRTLLDSVMNNKPFENPSNPAGNANGMTYKRAAVLAAGIGAVAWYIAARRDTRKPPTEDLSGDPMHTTKPGSDSHKQH